MVAKILTWFEGLSPVQKIATGGALSAGIGGILWWRTSLAILLWTLAIVLVVILAVWALSCLLKARARKRGTRFDSALINDIKKAKGEIGEQFEQALDELQANGVNVYKLPWYFFVGEPQGGKTFTIKRSGVDLPIGDQGISGAGGTRDCDFWFTNEAVILDTAGRLTVQEDDVIDREQWNQLLRLLIRFRANCPINGVLVGIPCTALLDEDSATRENKALIVRNRLKELQSALKVHFPIFFVILKTDLVFGFESFSRRLPVLERKQLFGWASEARFDVPFDPAEFEGAFESICQNLNRWRMKFLSEESSTENVDQFYVFPEEFRALKEPIREYLDKIFIKGPFGQAGFFRGFFFTSSLQEGRSIPRAISSILGGIEDQVSRPIASQPEIEARSNPFFVRDFYTKKVFREQGLVLRTDRSRLVNTGIRETARWGGGVIAAVGVLLLLSRFYIEPDELEEPGGYVKEIETETDELGTLTSLGAKIADWDKQEFWIWGAPWRAFFPSPAADNDLLDGMRAIYIDRLGGKYLRDFLEKVLVLIQQGGSDGQDPSAGKKLKTWQDFLDRSESLVSLAELAASRSQLVDTSKETASREADLQRFRQLKEYYLEYASRLPESERLAKDYVDQLDAEYRRFLEFGGEPSSLRPGGEKSWDQLEASVAALTRFLSDELLDPAKVSVVGGGPDSGFGVGYADELKWWRGLLQKSHRFEVAYGNLLDRVVEMDSANQPVALSVVTRRDFRDKIQRPWESELGFTELRTAWNELDQYAGARQDKGDLRQQLDAQKAVIKGLYDRLTEALSSSESRGARDLVSNLTKEVENVLAEYDALDQALRTNLVGLAYLVDSVVAESVDTEDGEKEEKEAKRVNDQTVQLSSQARAVWEKLKFLDRLVSSEPDEVARWHESVRTLTVTLADEYSKRASQISAPIEIAEADQKSWRKDQFDEFVRAVATGALSNMFGAFLFQHYERAVAPGKAGENHLALDEWFADPTGRREDPGLILLRARIDPSYMKECHAALRKHVYGVVEFLEPGEEGKAAPTYLILNRDDTEVKTAADFRLLFTLYESRYLGHWYEQLDEIDQLSYSEDEVQGKSWPDFQRSLEIGFKGRRGFESLFDSLQGTIRLAGVHLKAVSVEDVSKETGGEYSWARSLAEYEKQQVEGETRLTALTRQLKDFARYVGDLPDDPVEAMKKVRQARDERSAWLAGFLKTIRDWQQGEPLMKKDLFALKLLTLSRQGLEILRKDCRKEFESRWSALSVQYGETMDGKFPFIGNRILDAVTDCRIVLGEDETQMDPGDFAKLIGDRGEITRFHAHFQDCFAGDENDYGIHIGKVRQEFLTDCENLRRFILDEKTSGRFRTVSFEFDVPGNDHNWVRDLGDRSVYKQNFSRFRFEVGTVSKLDHFNNVSPPQKGSWVLPPTAGSTSRVAYSALDGRNAVAQARLKDAQKGAELCPQRTVTIPLEFEARGPWAFVAFLKRYGRAESGDRARWRIRYQTPEIEVGGQFKSLEIYFTLALDKALEALPDWRRANSLGGR